MEPIKRGSQFLLCFVLSVSVPVWHLWTTRKLEWRVKDINNNTPKPAGRIWWRTKMWQIKEERPLISNTVKTRGSRVNNQIKWKAAKFWDVFCQLSRMQLQDPIILKLQEPLNIIHFKLFYGYIKQFETQGEKKGSTQCPRDNSHSWCRLLTLGSSP